MLAQNILPPPSGRWTLADVAERFPNNDGNRYEIINGQLYITYVSDRDHQEVIDGIVSALGSWNGRTGAGQLCSEVGIIFADDDVITPDLVWVRADRCEQVLGNDGKLYEAPDLVVEVWSQPHEELPWAPESRLVLYDRRGVQEYWVVRCDARQIEVYLRIHGMLQRICTYNTSLTLNSPLLTGFTFPVSSIFAA